MQPHRFMKDDNGQLHSKLVAEHEFGIDHAKKYMAFAKYIGLLPWTASAGTQLVGLPMSVSGANGADWLGA